MEKYFSIKYSWFSTKQGLCFGLCDALKHKTGARVRHLPWIQKAKELTSHDK